jgi:hypothetical protein
VHYGYAESLADYARLLWDADIVLSTAIHEFFGVSIVEAIYCGCLPILPRRLSYPELIPAEWHGRCLYDDFDGLLARLRAAIADPQPPMELQQAAAQFDWLRQIEAYDALLADVAAAQSIAQPAARPLARCPGRSGSPADSTAPGRSQSAAGCPAQSPWRAAGEGRRLAGGDGSEKA